LPKADTKLLAETIVKISQLANVKEIKEAEINPMIIKEGQEGLVAVDGLITLN
jgi:succinyl-CoA synthetase beta subunit